MTVSCCVERRSGEHKYKTLRCNSYFNKVSPPASMVTDVMHLELDDSVLNNLVSRNVSYILWNMYGPQHICFRLGSWRWPFERCSPQREPRSRQCFPGKSCRRGGGGDLLRNQGTHAIALASGAACKQCSETGHIHLERQQFKAFVVIVKWVKQNIIIRTLQRWERILVVE